MNSNIGRRMPSALTRKIDSIRQSMYGFLSRSFRQELTRDTLSQVLTIEPQIEAIATAGGEDFFSQGSRELKKFSQKVPQIEDLVTELGSEFATLFLTDSTKPRYPCESVYRDKEGLVMQWPRDQVLDIYRSQSLVKANDCPEPEDYLSLELAFMARLAEKAKTSSAKKQRELISHQKDFLTDHLLTWVPNFCLELAQAARSPFYAAIAHLALGWLNLDNELLDGLINDQFSARAETLIGTLPDSDTKAWNHFSTGDKVFEEKAEPTATETRVIYSTCSQDCGGQCPFTYYVREGRIVKVEPHDVGFPEYRPCPRGLVVQYRVYAPDRLKFPLKRVGKRGEGKFIRVSWDEALSEVASQIVRIRDAYGPAAIMNLSWSGSTGRLHHNTLSRRFLNMAGGQTKFWGGASYQGALFSNLATYGRLNTGHYRYDLLNSRMIILWGCDPARTIFGTETRYYLAKAKKQGTKIVCVDPRFTNSAATWASQWIPVRPGTDAAMLVAMAYVILKKGVQDQNFLDKYTVGFDKFRDYVLGDEDGVAKTPEWAEKITGVPADTITRLALEYATERPAALLAGIAPGRSAAGEQYHRAAITLAVLSGNVGIPGGCPAGLDLGYTPKRTADVAKSYSALYTDIDETPNPVEKGQPLHEYSVCGIRRHTAEKPSCTKVWDNILRGEAGGYFSDIKMLYVTNGNCLNQMPNTNQAVKAFHKLEFVVVHDQFLTPTARYADIILPACTWCERNDIKTPWQFGHYFVYVNKAIEPMYQTKTDLQIFTELAEKLGITDFAEKTEDEWLRQIAAAKGIPDYDSFKTTGFYQPELPKDYVAFSAQLKDLEHNPFPTPSGKIEIFSQRIADFNHPDVLPPIPKYVETWEGVADPKHEKYPLQLITIHPPHRVHSQLYNVSWLKDVEPHTTWINPADAQSRNISDRDIVKVSNDRGTILIPARVTARIMPGVVSIYEGAWYQPDASGIDHGGCANILTRGEHSPSGAFCSNTVLVQIEKA